MGKKPGGWVKGVHKTIFYYSHSEIFVILWATVVNLAQLDKGMSAEQDPTPDETTIRFFN